MVNLDYLDTYKEQYITCPYCKYEDPDSWELEESGEVFCGNCEKEFFVEREVDITYTSSKND